MISFYLIMQINDDDDDDDDVIPTILDHLSQALALEIRCWEDL